LGLQRKKDVDLKLLLEGHLVAWKNNDVANSITAKGKPWRV